MLTPNAHAPLHVSTELAHLYDDPQSRHGAVNPPVYHASTYAFPDYETWKANVTGIRPREFTYNRSHNPTTKLLEQKIAHLEGADDCIASSSGMSAVSMALMGLLNAGDHVLCINTVYGPVRATFTSMLSRFGVETTFFPCTACPTLADYLRPNTRLIYVESPSTGLFEIQDLAAVAKLAKEKGIWTAVDNTWATPLFQKPIQLGIDVSIHSATKYIGGHSDLMFGLTAGTAAAMAKIRRVYTLLGACPGPDDSYLALRGLRTLHVRMAQHQANGLKVARWLAEQPDVVRVNHPGLENFPGHEIHRSQCSGDSGLFSFELQPRGEAARAAFVNSLRFFGLGYSWGGYESLLSPLAFQHYGNRALRDELGLRDDQFRVSIGLEDADDIIADLTGALAAYRKWSAISNQ